MLLLLFFKLDMRVLQNVMQPGVTITLCMKDFFFSFLNIFQAMVYNVEISCFMNYAVASFCKLDIAGASKCYYTTRCLNNHMQESFFFFP